MLTRQDVGGEREMIRHLRLLEVRRLASDGCGAVKPQACGLREVAVGEQPF